MGYAVKIKQEVKSWRKNKDYRRKEQEKDGERTALGEVGASVSTLENWGGRREGIFSTLLFIFFPQISVFDPGNSEEVPGTVYTCCTTVCTRTVNQS